MDETNGPIFDHHDELFAEQQLKDFVLEMTGSAGGGSSGTGADLWNPQHRGPDPMGYPMVSNCNDQSMAQRTFFQPNDSISYDMHSAGHDSASTFLDNLVKTLPDEMLDGLNGLEAIKRSLMALPEKPEQPPAPLAASLMDTMHRISTDNGTQEYLDNLSKPDNPPDPPLWNGIDHFAFQTNPVTKPAPVPTALIRNIDRNGNCPLPGVYQNGLLDRTKSVGDMRNHDVTKSRLGFSTTDMLNHVNHDSSPHKSNQPLDALDFLQRELSQSKSCLPLATTDVLSQGFLKSLSPSVSAESGIHTPTTSYESASPLSSSRTPLRSDDSISPLASCASPATSVRTDCFSPGRVRRADASPRAVPSPAMRPSMKGDDVASPLVRMPVSPAAPSPRPVTKTPLRPDDVPSPRPIARTPLRTDDALSPRGVSRTPLRLEEVPSPRAVSRTPLRNDDALSPRTPNPAQRSDEAVSPRAPSRTPLRGDEAPSPRAPGRTPIRVEESSSPRGVNRTSLRQEETTSPRSVSRTPLRPEDVSSPRAGSASVRTDESVSPRNIPRLDVSPLPPSAPFSPGSMVWKEADLPAGPASPVAGPSGISVAKPRKRKKTEALSGPMPKRRWNKKMPIYQSTVTEESGIKLKLKLTSMPPPKRRRRRTGDEEGEKTGKRRKRPPSPMEQSPWGEKLPPHLLERIFQMVVDEEGCVPSLVRFSWVCRLWKSVASKAELWQKVDLSSPCIKQKCKIDRYFRWLLENRLGALRDLNLNGWKFSNLPMVLTLIGAHCSEVESIGLSGWQGLHFEHLKSLLQDCPRLARIDLSDVSPESKSTNSAVSPKSITYLTETMGTRLTEITLAHNTLSCLPQIISSLAMNCPNLQVLDLSNIRRASHAEFALHVEELQNGCPKLRVLRITNSCITIAAAPLLQQAGSPGFPLLEELSIAGHQGTESLRITSVMDDDGLERIVKTSHKLRLLDVRGCTRITESSLVRVPAWDIQHLFLSGCLVTRQSGSGLELIAQKWSHSLVEVDLAWASVAEDLNAAVLALAERGADSPLRVVNLCGSAVEPAPVKTLLTRCPQLESLNLQSCRGLPRGVKRLYERHQLPELLEMLQSSDDHDEG